MTMFAKHGETTMPRSKTRNKKYRPRFADNVKLKAQLWKVAAVFQPLEAILDQLEQRGTIDVTCTDVPIFKDFADGNWYDMVAALDGVIEAYEIHEIRAGVQIDLTPLRKLSKKLSYRMQIFESDTTACRACLARMKRETLEMTAGYARDLIRDFQIKEQLERVAND